MSRAFDVTSSTPSVTLNAEGKGELAFTVSNALGKPVRARFLPVTKGSTGAGWLKVSGASERELTPDGTHQVLVEIAAPAGTPAGRYEFALLVSSVNNPDDEFAESPVVSFDAGASQKPPPPFPWWLVAVIVGALVLAGGGYGLYRWLSSRGCTAASCPQGCCQDNVCRADLSLAQCGKAGAHCAPCDAALADSCTAGACQCGAGPACGNGQRCQGGACVCDPMLCANGCCDGSACKVEAFPTCGVGGGACRTCDAVKTDRCLNGGCGCGPLGGECGAGQRCKAGQCVCDSTTCADGCCAGATCVKATSLGQCGQGGQACVACNTAFANTCVGGACRCGTGPSCGGDQRCSNGSCAQVCQTRNVSVRPGEVTLVPPHTRGDREFKGHGPKVTFSLQLFNSGSAVSATIRMKAEETESDWTTAEGARTDTVFVPQQGWRVSRILSPTLTSHSYTDTDHGNDVFTTSGPAARLEYVGDVEGNEAGNRTSVRVGYAPLQFEVTQFANCVSP